MPERRSVFGLGSDARILTIMFTDLVGSVELTRRLGDQTTDEIRRAHFAILREAVAGYGGEEVKSMGDGLMVAFTSASDAVECAVSIQQAVDRHKRREDAHPIEVRIGAHVAEPTPDEGDYYGDNVNLAKRLCDAAAGGQILITETLRWLVRGRTGVQLRALGTLELKGIDEPVAVHEAMWVPQHDAPIPLPDALTAPTRTPFVGRAELRQELAGEWKHAVSGERRLVLLAGEPGVGKTRTAADLARRAHEEGGIVLYGRCDPDGVIPYQPFLEGVGHYVRTCGDTELRAQVGETGVDLVRLLPELRERLPDLPEPAQMDPEAERYRLFRSVSHLLSEAARSAPLLFVLDDLHWSEGPTLALLRHVMRTTQDSPILLLGTYRDVELGRRHPLTEILHEWRREGSIRRIPLRGLVVEEVVSFVDAVTANELDDPGATLARVLHRETEGNPFFLEEILFHLMETGALHRHRDRWVADTTSIEQLEIPEGIREAVGRRLARLSETANEALAQASVIGPRFHVDVLGHVTALDPDALAEALEEARDAQLLTESLEDGVPSYAFAHALVHQVLSEELSLPRRQRLHLRVADTLEALRTREPPVGAIASHYRAAGAAADPQKTVSYSLLAASAAAAVYAFEDALLHLEAARDLMRERGGDPVGLARVLGALGDLRIVTGLSSESFRELEEGVRLYEEAGDEIRAAQMRSRLGRNLSTFQEWMDIDRAVEQFRTAEATLSRHKPGIPLAYTYAGLATTAAWAVRTDQGLEASRRAMEIAEQLGHDTVWANAAIMHAWHTCAAGRPAEGLALFDRAYEVAERITPHGSRITFFSVWMSGGTLLCLSDHAGARASFERELAKPYIAESPALAAALADQLYTALVGVGAYAEAQERQAELGFEGTSLSELVRMEGDLEAARQAGERQREETKRRGNRFIYGVATFRLARTAVEAGDLEQAESLLMAALEALHEHLLWQLTIRVDLVHVFTRRGRIADADAELVRCREILGDGVGWRGAPALVAQGEGMIAAARGDVEGADRSFDEMAEILRRYSAVWEEWRALWQAAIILRDAGATGHANRMFDRFCELVREHGFGQAWIDRAAHERPR